MKKSQEHKYSASSNLFYLYKGMWKENPKNIISITLRAAADMLLPLLSSGIVAVIIAIVSQENGWQNYRILFGISLLATVICMILSETMGNYENAAGNVFRVINMMKVSKMTLHIPFHKLEQPENIKKIEKAGETVNDPSGAFQKGFTVLYNFLRDIVGLLLYGYLVGSIHPAIISIIILFSIVMYYHSLGTNKIAESSRKKQAPLTKKTNYLVNYTGEFKAAKDMRLYHMEPWFEEEFQKTYDSRFLLMKKVFQRKFQGTALSGVFSLIRDGLAYWILVNQVIDGSLSVASFSFYFGIIASISQWTNGLLTDLADFRYMSGEIQDFREFSDLEFLTNRGTRNSVELKLPIEIEFQNVCYRYAGAEEDTIHNLNLKIFPGEKVGLVGINGAGKSTIIKLLCGLYEPTSGEILINGISQLQFTEESYYDLFSAVFQDYFELPITIEETIKQSESIHSEAYSNVLARSGIKEELRKFPHDDQTKLVKRVHTDAVDLSGGQKQKLQLARALYKNAPILILDEPTAALDPIAENEVYLSYNAIAKDKTSIFISHRLSSTRFCDRIVYLENGMIVEQGTHVELLEQKGKYAEMYSVQSQYYQEEWEGKKNEQCPISQ